ncbi:MAG: hypothetical protein KF784_09805 [Fimbriimonadaceae bacterium]|nr:hypothetical protein [Fimbriimonadaceae bacterium]
MSMGSEVLYCQGCHCEYAEELSSCPNCGQHNNGSIVSRESVQAFRTFFGAFVCVGVLLFIVGLSHSLIAAIFHHLALVWWAYLPLVLAAGYLIHLHHRQLMAILYARKSVKGFRQSTVSQRLRDF